MSLTSVLESKDKRDDGGHGENDAKRIHLQHLLACRRWDWLGLGWRSEEKSDYDSRDSPDGKVDVEAPAP